MYYVVSSEGYRLGPLKSDELPHFLRSVGAGEHGYFTGFVERCDWTKLHEIKHGEWAVFWVEVVVPRPVNVVDTWEVPEL